MKGGLKMCYNRSYYKIAIGIVISLILGLVSGIVFPDFFTNFNRILLAALATSAVTLIILTIYLIFRNTKNPQCTSHIKPYLVILLYSAAGTFIMSIITLTTTLTASIASSVLFGITVGLFSLLVISIVLTLKYFTDN